MLKVEVMAELRMFGWTYREIGEISGCSENAARKRLQRFRKNNNSTYEIDLDSIKRRDKIKSVFLKPPPDRACPPAR